MNIFFKYSNLDYPIPSQLGFQASASPIMRGIVDLHHHIMFFLVFILIFTFCMLYYTLENYTVLGNNFNSFNKIKKLYNINITHHTLLETIWIIIPSLILLSIVLPSFALLYAMDITKDCLLSMKVIGHQWYWSYEFSFNLFKIYFDFSNKINFNSQILDNFTKFAEFGFDSYMVPTEDLSNYGLRLLETTNPVVLPYKTYIRVCVTASDVIHSWAVPSLGVKIDALPGRLNQVMLYIDRLGRYYGQCSELCGVNHGFMPIEIYAISGIDYKIYLTYACENLRDHQKFFFIFISAYENNLINLITYINSTNNTDLPSSAFVPLVIKKNFNNWSNNAFKDLLENKINI